MGLLPVLILFVLALWQLGLVGYTYVLAGHAAQEGARMLAVNPTDGKPDDDAYKKIRTRAMGEVPKAWRDGARGRGARRTSRPSPCGCKVPVVLPGLKSPFAIGSRAATRGRGRGAAAVAGDHAGADVDAAALARRSAARRRPSSWGWCSGCCSPPCPSGS